MRWLLAILAVSAAAKSLPPGTIELHSEMVVEGELRGDPAGTTLRMAPDFQGRAAVVLHSGAVLHDLTIEGNGEITAGLPPWNVPFARFSRGNGVLIEGAAGATVERVKFRNLGGFAVLASAARDVRIEAVDVADSGSHNSDGKNNTTGGILLEEGTVGFRVAHCRFRNVRGNGVWTHSLYTSPRNAGGEISANEFEAIGRDAIQVGHAIGVVVEGNAGREIGYPKDVVDATPAALDTAGNVEWTTYRDNRFDRINGKCIDLDGFHDGAVTGNECREIGGYGIVFNNTNPDMQSRNIRLTNNTLENVMYGGIFLIGSGHTVEHNRLLNLNTSRCDGCGYVAGEPDMLDSGIYLGRKAERPAPARGNVVENNEIVGYKMKARCVGRAPGIQADWNTVRGNVCKDPTSSHP